MLIIENQEHFDKVREFAASVGADAELQKRLDFLAGFGGDPAKVRCRLYSDLHPTASSGGLNTARSKAGNPGLSAA
jgi:hypothetical protein